MCQSPQSCGFLNFQSWVFIKVIFLMLCFISLIFLIRFICLYLLIYFEYVWGTAHAIDMCVVVT